MMESGPGNSMNANPNPVMSNQPIIAGNISMPIAQPGQNNDDNDLAMDEEIACNMIPISNFKSNNIKQKEQFIQPVGMMSPGGQAAMHAPLSPQAEFCMRDNNFKAQSNKSYLNSVGVGNGLMD